MKLRALAYSALVVAVGTAGTLFAAAPAVAEPACEAGYICMWEDPGYAGSKYVEVRAVSGGIEEIYAWEGDNEISSLSNRSNCSITLYDLDADEQDTDQQTVRFHPEDIRNVSDLTAHDFDNDAESFRVGHCTT